MNNTSNSSNDNDYYQSRSNNNDDNDNKSNNDDENLLQNNNNNQNDYNNNQSKTIELSTSVYISFIIISFGYMLPWTALGSLISYYKILYDANFYLDIYISYYILGLPISILQYLYDDTLDRSYTSYRTYIYRGIICYSMMIMIILSLIWIHNRYVIVFLFGMLGKKQFSIHIYIFVSIYLFINLYMNVCISIHLSI